MPSKNISFDTIMAAQVVYGNPIEKEMIDVVNLNPGESTKFLFYRVYFIDLKASPFLTQDPEHPKNKFLTSIDEPCRWDIKQGYFQKVLRDSEYAIVCICNDGSKWSGIKSFVLAKRDPLDPKGIYIHLTCNNKLTKDIEDFRQSPLPASAKRWRKTISVPIKIRTGMLLTLAMFNYAKHHLGIHHAYNAAASINLVKVYKNDGYSLRTTNCDEDDDISLQFNELPSDQLLEYTESQVKSGRYKKDLSDSYPMKLCKYNFNSMFKVLFDNTIQIYDNLLSIGVDLHNADMCKFA
jgi:hypothetical protein